MEILVIIPARGGSVRLPRKNLKRLGDKSLLGWAIEQAKSSLFISRVVVSTDDDEIATLAPLYGAEVIRCPSALHTGDEMGTIQVVNHTLMCLGRYYGGYQPPIVVLLQPTTPLRNSEDIDNTIRLLIDSGAESAISVCQGQTGANGAVYVSKRSVWLQGKVIGEPCVFYEMPAERSVDIDTQEDLDLAEKIMAGGKIDNSGVLHKLEGHSRGKTHDKSHKRGRPRKSN